ISYSHTDEKWLKELRLTLSPHIRYNKITIWDDTQIRPGEPWKEQIEKAPSSAKVAVLLVSRQFLASPFINENELPPLLENARKNGLLILWILIEPCAYHVAEIAQYQAAHNLRYPLVQVRGVELTKLLVKICDEIKDAVTR